MWACGHQGYRAPPRPAMPDAATPLLQQRSVQRQLVVGMEAQGVSGWVTGGGRGGDALQPGWLASC